MRMWRHATCPPYSDVSYSSTQRYNTTKYRDSKQVLNRELSNIPKLKKVVFDWYQCPRWSWIDSFAFDWYQCPRWSWIDSFALDWYQCPRWSWIDSFALVMQILQYWSTLPKTCLDTLYITTIGLRFLSWFFGMYLKKSTGLQTQSFSSLVLCDVTGNISLFCMCGLEDQEVFRGWSLVKKLAFPLPSTTLTSSSVFRRAKKRT